MTVGIELSSGWLRLEFFLPVNTNEEARAVQLITAKLTEQYKGSTHSIARPPVFRGWYEDDQGELIPDSICLLLVFVKADLEQARVEESCGEILRMVDARYKRARSPQKEVWMLANSHNIFALKNS